VEINRVDGREENNEILKRIISKNCEKGTFQKTLVRACLETDSYDLGKESLCILEGV
jgi:hypothetical protein